MQSNRIELLPSAWQDLNRIADTHIQLVGPASAERITTRILDALERLSDFPYLGPLHHDPVLSRMEYRKLVCGEYVCVYKVLPDAVYVYRIVHGKTDYPRYFK